MSGAVSGCSTEDTPRAGSFRWSNNSAFHSACASTRPATAVLRVCDFLRSSLVEQVVMLRAPDRRDADDYEYPCESQQVRLVRHVTPNGKVRVLMTNLFDTARFPASAFGDL
jgi:hypothetical protein